MGVNIFFCDTTPSKPYPNMSTELLGIAVLGGSIGTELGDVDMLGDLTLLSVTT